MMTPKTRPSRAKKDEEARFNEALGRLRRLIDRLDERIVKFLNRRAALTLKIGQLKTKRNAGIYAPVREKEVLNHLKQCNTGPLSDEALEAIYREIMSASFVLEKGIKIAYLGPEASFTHQAAQRHFGSQVSYVACDNISEVFGTVEHRHCDYGVVPIENSIEGAVTHTFDLLVDSELKICAQILLPISHHLMTRADAGTIKRIYSNPQVFGQCRNWLLAHMPHVELIDVVSTAKAAQRAAKERHAACIASALAAKVYGLTILKRDIQDVPHNITRFLVIAETDVPPSGRDRTSLMFSIKDRVGALYAMLEPFRRHRINLTKIESRPSKKKAWDYYFFVDCEGHREDAKLKKALAELDEMCQFMKVLGSYPE